jgi:hypothetical protein
MAKISFSAALLADDSSIKVSVSAANPYLSADGLIDVAALTKLANRIMTANGKIPESASRAKLISPTFYTAKPAEKYSASLEKKNDHKYKTLRGQQVKSRTKLPPAGSSIKFKLLLPALLEGADKTVAAEVRKAVSAINSHNKKAVKVVDKVKTEKGKIRDAANKEFDANVDVVTQILLAGGIKETGIAVGQSMFGKVVHVKLPNGGVISIGKSDTSKFNAAKKSGGETAAAPAVKPGRVTISRKAPAAKPARSARVATTRGVRKTKAATSVRRAAAK